VPRVTAKDVKDLLGGDYDSRRMPSVDPNIAEGDELTDDIEEYALAVEVSMTDKRYKLISARLAAFFYKMAYDRVYSSKGTLDASASYGGQLGKGLESNQYGMAAMLLDKSGYLSFLNENGVPPDPNSAGPGTATGMWLGKSPSERLTIDEQQ
jgi:hypothetical protein